MTYRPQIAFQSTEEIFNLQNIKLQELLSYLKSNSPFYQNFFNQHAIDITSIKTVSDLVAIPPIEKEHLQLYNEQFLCVSKDKVIEYTSTSGTLGTPVTIALTENDLHRLAHNEYTSFSCADGGPNDIYQLMLTLDRQFMAGMAYYSGIRKLGAGIIRVGPGVPSLQWETIAKLKPTAIVAVPSFILKLLVYAKENGIDVNKFSVKKAVCIGENIRNIDFSSNVLGEKITREWNIKLYSTYASTEMQTAFTECSEGKGGHHNPELVIVELLDENNSPVKLGAAGEVTITTLGVEGMPLLRYKTGDICIANTAPCICGRNSLRLSPIIGRKKQMIKFKGTTLFAPALFDILNGMSEVSDYVVEVTSNEISTDEVLLYLLPTDESEATDHQIRAYLQAKLRVSPHIKYLTAEAIQKIQFPENTRKPIKFIDNRSAIIKT